MIEIGREKLVPLKEARRVLPGRTGRGVSLATLWRWVLSGRRGRKLESILVGGTRYTSYEALMRFAEPSARSDEENKSDGRSPHGDQAAMVDRALVDAGF